ncbi:MAG: pantoate--beta-alanine ligase [Verrucomicrobia bacterium]|nr:MAG: pantoate--beta-alanine ligase [Verrucomicrobiota bacterium]
MPLPPKIFTSIKDWQTFRKEENLSSLCFVPTMGNLHLGHQSLLERSSQENTHTLLTIFINPTQFNNKEDLENYPRTLESDIAIAQQAHVNFILAPTFADIYPDNYTYKMSETNLSNLMEGKHRPNHFDGMLTIVLKLLLIAKATRAYFGEKDFQQLQLVQNLAQAFFLDTEIISCPTIRDQNGFALSSRNTRLTPEEYTQALNFPKLLSSHSSSPQTISQNLKNLGFKVDYIEEHDGRRFGAVSLGNVRLIDNFNLKS